MLFFEGTRSFWVKFFRLLFSLLFMILIFLLVGSFKNLLYLWEALKIYCTCGKLEKSIVTSCKHFFLLKGTTAT